VSTVPLSEDAPDVSILVIGEVLSVVSHIFLELWEGSHLEEGGKLPQAIEFIGEEILQSPVGGGLQSRGLKEKREILLRGHHW
jgi:hypothetical protein